jgi:hypothetical protein
MCIYMIYIMINYFNIDKNLIKMIAAEIPGKGWHMYVYYMDNKTIVDGKIKDRWLTAGGELDTNTIIYTYDQAVKIAEYTHDPEKAKY